MIWLDLNEPLYEYDIHSLVKAFYPQEDVAFVLPKGEETPLMTVRVRYQRDEAASGTTSGSIFFAVKTEEGEEYTESEVDFSDRPQIAVKAKQTNPPLGDSYGNPSDKARERISCRRPFRGSDPCADERDLSVRG